MADNRTERNVSNGDWKKGSRKRADERGNYRHPRYRGGLPQGAIEALERAREKLVVLEKKQISKCCKQ